MVGGCGTTTEVESRRRNQVPSGNGQRQVGSRVGKSSEGCSTVLEENIGSVGIQDDIGGGVQSHVSGGIE